MASLYTNELLPTSAEQAIRIFDERYLAGISTVQPPTWVGELGEEISLDAPRVTFPISFLSTKYVETREESGRFKTMQDKTFDLKPVEYDAGYEVELIYLKTNVWAYRNWGQVPARFLTAEKRHVNRAIATLLEAGTSETSPWDGVAFFSASHKANPGGDPSTTWSNYQSSASDVTDISKIMAEITAMKGVLDENGEKMPVDPDLIIVPTGKAEAVRFALAQQLILQGSATAPTSNPYFGNRFRVLEIPELTDVNDWYLVDTKLMAQHGVPLWVAAKYQAPSDLGLRFFDETSDYFKNTGKIKVSSHIWYGFKLLFPHAIRRIVGA
jgi:hypothetical protein